MGCAASGPAKEPAPKDAPEDWKATVMATFRSIDKNSTGTITLIPYKKRETVFSELSVLGDPVLEKQKELGDFPAKTVTILEWIDIIKAKVEEKGWGPVNEYLQAVDAVVKEGPTSSANQSEQLAKKVFKDMDSNWAEPANTGALDFLEECKALADETDLKAKSLLDGLEAGKKISSADWVAHCNAKVEPLGFPRVMMQLRVIDARLEKVSDTGDMTAGM